MADTAGRSRVELVKEASRGLRGTIAEELNNGAVSFSKPATGILKFHGIYQQEDRDLRKSFRERGEEKAYEFMVRIRNPGGGRLTAEQWVALDEIADRFGNQSLRITSRQGVQFHGVGKENLRHTIQRLNQLSISTFGACGDGNRNTMACPVSGLAAGSEFRGGEWAALIADRLSFKTSAYFEVWLDGEPVSEPEEEPLYGKAYLPRKFKIAVGDPHDNCVDLLTNDLGILPALEAGSLRGFHVFVGGGLGSTHDKTETFPRLAEALTCVPPDQLLDLVEAVVATQRDLGNRADRRQARMKYLVENLGIAAFRMEVEKRLGAMLPAPREHRLSPVDRHFGWHPQEAAGMRYLGLFVENGRIVDREDCRMKTGLRVLIELFQPTVYLTPNQDLIIADIPERHFAEVRDLVRRFGLEKARTSRLRGLAMACPALPTCGLAITEAERRLPGLITELEAAGFGEEEIVIRMSGCPNSCSRPPVAEIGLIGKSIDGYHLFVGGKADGTRLARLLRKDVPSGELALEIGRLIRLYRRLRSEDESFGDFCDRMGPERLGSEAEVTG